MQNKNAKHATVLGALIGNPALDLVHAVDLRRARRLSATSCETENTSHFQYAPPRKLETYSAIGIGNRNHRRCSSTGNIFRRRGREIEICVPGTDDCMVERRSRTLTLRLRNSAQLPGTWYRSCKHHPLSCVSYSMNPKHFGRTYRLLTCSGKRALIGCSTTTLRTSERERESARN